MPGKEAVQTRMEWRLAPPGDHKLLRSTGAWAQVGETCGHRCGRGHSMSTKCELHTEGGALENHNAEDEQEEKLAMIKSEELRGRRKTRKRGSPKSQEQRVSENG